MASIDDVEDISPVKQYVATASQTQFDFPFPITADADLTVYDNNTLQVLSTDYTVSGVGNDTGGTITFNTGRTAGHVITIYRDIPIARTTDFQQNGPFASVAVNDELDKITMILQQLESRIGRAVRMSLRNPQSSDDLELDAAFAGKYLYVNDDGELEPAAAVSSTTLTQSIIGELLHPRTPAEIAAGVTPVDYGYPELYAERYGYLADDSTDNSAALSNANLVATEHGGADISVPQGTGRITSDFTLSEGNALVGRGYGAVLHCVGCSVKVDANAANEPVEFTSFRNLSLKRTGSAGPVIDLVSDHVSSANDFVANMVFDRVWITESTGDGIRVRGTVGITFRDLYVTRCAGKGVRLEGNSANSDVNNSIVFLRGTIISCDVGIWMVSAQNVLLNGTVVEACTSAGIDITRNCHQIMLYNTWCESNGGFDVRVGVDTASGNSHNIRIIGGNFVDGNDAKDHAIELIIAKEVFIDNCSFNGYTTEAIANNENSSGAVTGHIGDHNELISTPSICEDQNVNFYQTKDARGSFTGTLTGGVTSPTATLTWQRNGNLVTLFIPEYSVTSNATTMTITGMPASTVQPATAQYFPVRISDNGGSKVWGIVRIETTGVLTFFATAAGGAFTASGTKSFDATSITYSL